MRTSKRIKHQKQELPRDSEEEEEEEEIAVKREKMAGLRDGGELLDMSDAEFMVGRMLCTHSLCK